MSAEMRNYSSMTMARAHDAPTNAAVVSDRVRTSGEVRANEPILASSSDGGWFAALPAVSFAGRQQHYRSDELPVGALYRTLSGQADVRDPQCFGRAPRLLPLKLLRAVRCCAESLNDFLANLADRLG